MTTETPGTPQDPPPAESPRVRDARVPLRGVLPKQIQTWLMVGIALVIILIILITGHSDPPARTGSTARPSEPALAPADRIRTYAQQLAQEEQRQTAAAARGTDNRITAGRPAGPGGRTGVPEADPRRDDQSLFADNIALSRRPRDQQPLAAPPPSAAAPRTPGGSPSSDELVLLDHALSRISPPPVRQDVPSPAPVQAAVADRPRVEPDSPVATSPAEEFPAPGQRLRLLEGTMVETTLVNRLDGTFAGPVVCLVTTPVYSQDRQAILIPAGARVLGAASPVQSWGDTRLAVSFHRLVMPDGHTYSLNLFKGLNQIGESGLRDSVNRHYLQVFGASLAIGALSGLAQYGTRSGSGTYDFGAEYRQAAGSSLATSSSRILDRYLNVLPTITVREGYRITVYLTNDLELPRYAAVASGGAQ